MNKVAIYARVSTTNGTQDYQRQISDLTKIIKQSGYSEEQIEIFAESISGYKKNSERPELNKLLRIIENEPKYFACIYATEISRLGRNPGEVRRTVDDLTELGVPIYIQSLRMSTIDADGKRNSIMNIILQVLMEFAHSESEQMKQRSRSGLLQSATQGKAGGGRNFSYGYTKDEDKMLVIEPDEAEVIKEIFELYKAGNGIKVIANILNDKNVPTRLNKSFAGKTIKFNIEKQADLIRWSDKQIHDIIQNPIYKGQRRFKGNLLSAPAIISEELFDECTAIREGKTHRNYLTTYTYLLKDIIKCGCCGKNFFGRYKPSKGGDKVYICSSRLKKGEGCGNKGVNIGLIESAIFNEFFTTEPFLKYLSEKSDVKTQLEADIKRLTSQKKIEENALVKKEKERERLLDLYLSEVITKETYIEKQNVIEKEINSCSLKLDLMKRELSQKRSLLQKQGNEMASKETLIEASQNRNQLQSIFREFIQKVIVNNIDSSYDLVSVYYQFNGVPLLNPLKFVLDKSSIRKEKYRYFTTSSGLENDPVYKDNILLVDLNDIKNDIEYIVQNDNPIFPTWVEVEKDLIININEN